MIEHTTGTFLNITLYLLDCPFIAPPQAPARWADPMEKSGELTKQPDIYYARTVAPHTIAPAPPNYLPCCRHVQFEREFGGFVDDARTAADCKVRSLLRTRDASGRKTVRPSLGPLIRRTTYPPSIANMSRCGSWPCGALHCSALNRNLEEVGLASCSTASLATR